MNILVFNGGSSSLSYKVFAARDCEHIEVLLSGKAHRVGVKGQEPSFLEFHFQGAVQKDAVPLENHQQAAVRVLQYIKRQGIEIDWIGHRFVHGGDLFKDSVILDEGVLEKLQACLPLASLHNPIAWSVIAESRRAFPEVPQYTTFDSAFHSTIPPHALHIRFTEARG